MAIDYRKEKTKRWFQLKVQQVKNFYYIHEEEIKTGLPIAIGVIGTLSRGGKKVYRKVKANREQHIKDTRYYDRSQNMYVKLRHKRSQDEWNEIHRRQAKGEKMGDILKDMDLIK